jgi:hypothetical protein
LASVRSIVRKAFRDALVGQTGAGANVFVARLRPLDEDERPCLLVHSGDDAVSTDLNGSPRGERLQVRRMRVHVLAVPATPADIDEGADLDELAADAADELATQVQAVLCGATLRIGERDLQLRQVAPHVDGDGVVVLDNTAMVFEVVMDTDESDPSRSIHAPAKLGA